MTNKLQHYGLEVPDDLKPFMGLVHKIAQRYHKITNPRIDYDDLVLVGMTAIYKAKETWDTTINPKFSSYAYTYIKNAIEKEFQKNINAISGGTPYYINNNQENREEVEYINAHMIPLNASNKMLERLDMTPPTSGRSKYRVSLKDIMVESGAGNPISNAEQLEIIQKVDEIIEELDNDAQDIVYRRVFDGDTFQKIAEAKQLSWRQVNYSFNQSLKELKDKFVDAGLQIYA